MDITIKSAPVSFEAISENAHYAGSIATKNGVIIRVEATVSVPVPSVDPEGNPTSVFDILGHLSYDNGSIAADAALAPFVVEFSQLVQQLNGNDYEH